MKPSVLVATVFMFVSACATENEIVAADEHHIAIQIRSSVLNFSDQVPAAEPAAKIHCAKYGKSPVHVSSPRPRGSDRTRFGGNFVVVTFACR
jgi:hypothetical protein